MILPIYIYGQSVLRKVAKNIEKDYPDLNEFITNMWETLEKSGGVGLAAPQVGRDIRVVLVDLNVLAEDLPEYKNFRKVYLNGEILEFSDDKDSIDEGCLSIPNIYEPVKRSLRIHVRYQDENFEEHDEWVEGYLARVIQHEFDHLEGHLFIDRLTPFRKQMIKSKLSKILKGKFDCTYKFKSKR